MDLTGNLHSPATAPTVPFVAICSSSLDTFMMPCTEVTRIGQLVYSCHSWAVTSASHRGEWEGARVRRLAAPSSCTYSPECVEGEFCELRVDGVLRSSHQVLGGGIMPMVERDVPL